MRCHWHDTDRHPNRCGRGRFVVVGRGVMCRSRLLGPEVPLRRNTFTTIVWCLGFMRRLMFGRSVRSLIRWSVVFAGPRRVVLSRRMIFHRPVVHLRRGSLVGMPGAVSRLPGLRCARLVISRCVAVPVSRLAGVGSVCRA